MFKFINKLIGPETEDKLGSSKGSSGLREPIDVFSRIIDPDPANQQPGTNHANSSESKTPTYFDLSVAQKNHQARFPKKIIAHSDSQKIAQKQRSTNPWDVLTSRYSCKEAIGQGGTSIVYRAIDQSMDREVALKRFHPGMGPEAMGSSYEKEVRIISRLSHPNIVTTHDMGHDHDGHFIIMSLIEGEDLKKYYKAKALELPIFQSIAQQCLDGLSHIHAENFLHLDLKPSNVMVTPISKTRLHAQIIDFGSARLMTDGLVYLGTDPQDELHGTIYYMSPEQFDRQPLDTRADIYSLGCMFYELLTGHRPFDGDNAIQVMAAHIQNKYTPLNEARPDLPEKLVKTVHSMIAKSRDARPESVSEIVHSFEEIEW